MEKCVFQLFYPCQTLAFFINSIKEIRIKMLGGFLFSFLREAATNKVTKDTV